MTFMKKIVLLFCIWLTVLSPAFPTQYSEFAAREFASRCNRERVHITVKKEHIENYATDIGDTFIPYIVYGYGDLKSKNCKKQRVTYICLLDKDKRPLWSYISFGK